MLGNIGTVELLVIMLVILLVFGSKRIPEIARGLGKGIREFKEATAEISNELRLDDARTHRRPTSVGRTDAQDRAAAPVTREVSNPAAETARKETPPDEKAARTVAPRPGAAPEAPMAAAAPRPGASAEAPMAGASAAVVHSENGEASMG